MGGGLDDPTLGGRREGTPVRFLKGSIQREVFNKIKQETSEIQNCDVLNLLFNFDVFLVLFVFEFPRTYVLLHWTFG